MSIKRILILLGIVLVVGVLGALVFIAYKGPQAEVELKTKLNDSIARSARRQVIEATEFYYDEKKTVPSRVTDLFTFSSTLKQSYLPRNAPGVHLVEYHPLDPKNAEVCLVFDSPIEQKCQKFTGKQ